MPFTITPASRVGVKSLIGVYGRSGGGKTRSALLLARGLAGPEGKIRLIDTENRRGHIFADVIPGGYEVIDFDPPFSPARYVEALSVAEEGASVVVIDSLSHGWEGEGGVLEMQEAELTRMAGQDWKKRESCKLAAWIGPKMEHKKLVQRILRSSCSMICCLRAQEKTHIEKDPETGKNRVLTDKFTSPIYDARFIFECLLNLEAYQKEGRGGFVNITKITHEELFSCLPSADEQIRVDHGVAIANWCAKRGGEKPGNPPAIQPSVKSDTKERNSLAKRLFDVTQSVHQISAADAKTEVNRHERTNRVTQWLIDEAILSDTESLAELPIERLRDVVAQTEAKIAAPK